MIEITEHKEKILKLMCSNVPPIYVPATSIESDGKAASDIDKDYEDSMELVNLGLVADVSTMPAYKKQVKELMVNEGRKVNVLTPIRSTHMMFSPKAFGLSASRLVN